MDRQIKSPPKKSAVRRFGSPTDFNFIVLLFRLRNWSASEIKDEIDIIFPDLHPSLTYIKFLTEEVEHNLTHGSRTNHKSKSGEYTNEVVEQVRSIVSEDRTVTCREIAAITGISCRDAEEILTSQLRLTNVFDSWVSASLTDLETRERQACSRRCLTRLAPDSWRSIIVVSEAWLYTSRRSDIRKLVALRGRQSTRQSVTAIGKLKATVFWDGAGKLLAHSAGVAEQTSREEYEQLLGQLKTRLPSLRPHLVSSDAPVLLYQANVKFRLSDERLRLLFDLEACVYPCSHTLALDPSYLYVFSLATHQSSPGALEDGTDVAVDCEVADRKFWAALLPIERLWRFCLKKRGILASSKDDFEDADEVYEAIGEVLHELEDKSENEVRQICRDLLDMLKGSSNGMVRRNNVVNKVLSAPIHMGSMSATLEEEVDEIKSIWVTTRDDATKVDAKKLEKAEAKLKQKQENRSTDTGTSKNNDALPALETATVSQVISKKDNRLEAKGGTNRTNDIRIENFDVAYGDRVLLQGADLTLAFGRRYGLVGRNGIGKTTLLRMISGKQLQIPSHIRVLHVEQEVAGDDTSALESVLESDVERCALLKREAELQAAIEKEGKGNDTLGEELAQVFEAMQLAEVEKAPARASTILSGLGFPVERQSWPTKAFSGGWRMRLALARALFSKPDLLLLDEPTNMIDVKAIIWLERYLQTWPTTLLVVSHDRSFLESVPTDILYLKGQKIESFHGNYDQFEKTKDEREKNQQREYEAQQAKRAHVQEFIDRFRYNANRASSVQSKIKMLDKLPELKAVEKESEVTLRFPDVDPLNPPILQINEASFRYPNSKDFVFTNVSLNADLQSRICIVGENGAGKTTLLKMITGALTPASGTVHTHRNLKFGYFSQHHVDQLDLRVCPVELLQNHFPGKPIEEYRRMLGSFGITGDLSLQTIHSLSGGQKSRVAFALMCAAMPNFMIFDEPSNHLDIESIEALGKAINTCKAGVILVSHDERLIRMVCKELWVCSGGTVKCLEGGFDEYKKIIEKELDL